MGIGSGSSVIYVEGEKRKILVDTGFEHEWDKSEANTEMNLKCLEIALSLKGLTPGDIDTLFITHWHHDHFGNSKLFDNAELMISKLEARSYVHRDAILVEDNEEIDDGIIATYTPGHTEGHCSLIVKGDITTAIAGDAIINSGYFKEGKLWEHNLNFFNREAGLESMKNIARSCDLIIPGHGTPFRTYEPRWMRLS